MVAGDVDSVGRKLAAGAAPAAWKAAVDLGLADLHSVGGAAYLIG